MELVFIRHGQGEHTTHLPQSLHTSDPELTQEGIKQASMLRKKFPVSEKDLIVISPLRRTLQTARIWTQVVNCHKVVSPFVSPRMFPQNPEWHTLPCDQLLNMNQIKTDFPDFHIDDTLPYVWQQGINTLPKEEFASLAERFLVWCEEQQRERIYIVTHDGTMTSYKQFISGAKHSRDDFPGETGWIKVQF
ncbi:histidine phosphatase family protein [Halobacillus sp. H74]|uniref:histidine phosphatase family protein n=1 Tax=Halobacillus sp. H74 TaxID=3457436 RepID=UPI003FCD29CC